MKKAQKILFRRSTAVTVLLLGLLTFLAARVDLYRDISDNWKLMYEVYKRVMIQYADQIDPEKLAISGVKGMLDELDPYSVYLENEERDGLRMLTKGRYGGVGIQLGVRDDSLTVIAPMEDSPAMRSGILPGDRIVDIDGESTKDMSLDEAAKKIRGEKGTKVVLTIRRFSESESLDFELTRDNIRIEDVSYSGIIHDNMGYVRLSRFSKNSPVEIRKAFRSLMEQGIDKLVLDLRGNPGGLLEAAVDILDMIIEKGDKILYTKGRGEEANREFVSKTDPVIPESVSLAILIDGGSASASEIVAGVVQDLDRGVVIGARSFGKGLVQSVYPLDRNRSLKLTTAKYYIPSGRLIQKPGYLEEDVLIGLAESDTVFGTRNGRKVLANGGIAPDIEVERMKVPALTRECWRRGLFFKFASLHVQEGHVTLPVVVDEGMLQEFREFVVSKDLKLNTGAEKEFHALETYLDSVASQNRRVDHSLAVLRNYFEDAKLDLFEKEKKQLTIGLEREFSSVLGGIGARIQSSFDDDPAILKAVEVLSDRVAYDHTLKPSEF